MKFLLALCSFLYVFAISPLSWDNYNLTINATNDIDSNISIWDNDAVIPCYSTPCYSIPNKALIIYKKPTTHFLRGTILKGASDCTTSSSIAYNVAIMVSPDPPILGNTVHITITYSLKEDILAGTVKYHALLNGFLPVDSSIDLCEDHAGGIDPCPLLVSNNPHTVIGKSDFPTGIKKIVSTINWITNDNTPILCAKLDYSF